MAVPEQTPYVEYEGNGVSKVFPLTFDCDHSEHLVVKVDDETLVVGAWSLVGNDVVFEMPPAIDSKITLQRNTPLERETNYKTYDNSFRPAAINKEFDRIWWKLQEIWVQIVLLWVSLNSKISALWLTLAKETQDRIKGDLDIRAWVQVLLNNIVDNGLISAIAVSTVESVNDLQYLVKWDGRTVFVKSYHLALNKGCGYRVYDSSRFNENDGFLCINGWVLKVENNTVTPEQAGCKGDGASDDATPLARVFTSKYKVECDPFATYKTSKPIEFFSGQKIKGNGATISKFSASTTGIIGRTDPQGNPYNYDQDCAVVFAAWYGWYSYIDIENLKIIKEKIDDEDVGIVFFAPYISMSTLKTVVVRGGEYGFYGEDLWMINWTRCEAYSKCGFYIGTGTSNTFDTCWSKETKAGYSAYRIHNLVYSTLKNCCAEFVGEDGKPAEAAFHISNSDLTMIGCGIEGIHAYNLIRIDYSWVTIDSPSFIYGINNKYRHGTYTGLIDVSASDSVVTLRGGRINSINTENFADAVRVDGGTFNFDSPLWTDVYFPDDANAFKIRISNYAAILNLSDFTGRKYNFNGRSKKWENKVPTSFSNGIVLNDLGAKKLSEIRKYAYFGVQGSGANGSLANEYPSNGFGGVILNFASGDDGVYTNAVQLAFPVNNNNPSFRRAGWSEQFSNWMKFYTSGNTTVTADGTLKAASPIVKLFADHIELNDEAIELNPEFEKIGIGHYLVKNTKGFAKDGWWIEVPSDSNGNKICAIEYQVFENGDIEVKTFKRKFDIQSATIVSDLTQPIDIPNNMNGDKRWIDLRLEELPKSDIILS